MKEIWSNVNYYLKEIQPEDCLSGLSVATKIDPLRELARLSIWCKTLEMKYSLAFSAENEHRLVLKLKDDNREMSGENEHGCKRNDNREITRIACHCETNPKWVQLKFTKLDNKNDNAGKKYIDCNCERPREDHGNGEFWPSCGLYIFESEFLCSDFNKIDIYVEKCCYDDCESKLTKAVVDENLLNDLDDFYCSYEPVIGELYWACEGK